MDWKEVRLLPAALLMNVSGIAALVLAIVWGISGHVLAVVPGASGVILLVAAQLLTAERRWSVRLASIAAPLGVPVWLTTLVAVDRPDDATATLLCLAMAGASGWAASFLRDEVWPPALVRTNEIAEGAGPTPSHGWIEDLPDGSVTNSAPPIRG